MKQTQHQYAPTSLQIQQQHIYHKINTKLCQQENPTKETTPNDSNQGS